MTNFNNISIWNSASHTALEQLCGFVFNIDRKQPRTYEPGEKDIIEF